MMVNFPGITFHRGDAMYRINDRSSAIERVQEYLSMVGNKSFFVVPTGVYDENTRLSVIEFQRENGINTDGIVDLITFNMLFDSYSYILQNKKTKEMVDSFISFPLSPGLFADEMIHINRMLIKLLDFYGHPHSLSESNYYSKSTSDAVISIRKIFFLGENDLIDEELYRRMIIDYDSIYKAKEFFD